MPELTEMEIRAPEEALDDEYRAWATYDQVIRDLGQVLPFTRIREAEGRHIEALHKLFARYGLPAPKNLWLGRASRYPSLPEACAAGVAAEIANGAIYDRLLAATEREDILRVFRNLRDASQQRHLPAFQRCANRPAGIEGGPRVRRRRRGREQS
jgi:hypothetical protein